MATITPARQNQTYLPGQLLSLHLHDFMCHNLFRIRFKPGINFIHGQNGAGKSAILTSICTLLGASQKFTSRGSNKELIRDGAQYSEIILEIKNFDTERLANMDCYSFFIKKKTTRTGQSTLQMANGRTDLLHDPTLKQLQFRKIKKEELSTLIETFNIQIANPCVIMNQDTAREFLNSKTAKERYNIFTKATLFENIDSKIEESLNNLKINKTELAKLAEKIEIQEKTFLQSEKEYKDFEKIIDSLNLVEKLSLKNLILSLKKLYNSLNISILEKIELSEKLEKLTAEKERKEIQKASKTENKKLAKVKLAETVDDLKTINESNKQINIESKSILLNDKKCDVNIRNQISNLTELHIEKENLEKKFGNFLNESQTKEKTELKAIEAKYKEKIMKKDSMSNSTEKSEKELTTIIQKIRNLEDATRQISNEIKENQDDLGNVNKIKLNYKNSKKSEILFFGNKSLEIQEFLKNNFKVKPMGPLGFYIGLTNKRWKSAVQNCIGYKSFYNYLVDNSEDYLKLNNYFEKIFRGNLDQKPNIIISKCNKNAYKIVKPSLPGKQFETVMDVIKIKNLENEDDIHKTWLTNLLIDLYNVETSILLPSISEGYQFFDNWRLNGTNRLVTVYCEDGSKMVDKNKRSIAKFPYLVKNNIFDNSKTSYDVSKLNEEIKRFSDIIKTLNAKLKTKTEEKDSLIKTKTEKEKFINKNKKEITKLEKEIQNVKVEKQKKELNLKGNTKYEDIQDRTSITKLKIEKAFVLFQSWSLKKLNNENLLAVKRNKIKSNSNQLSIKEKEVKAIKQKLKELNKSLENFNTENYEAEIKQCRISLSCKNTAILESKNEYNEIYAEFENQKNKIIKTMTKENITLMNMGLNNEEQLEQSFSGTESLEEADEEIESFFNSSNNSQLPLKQKNKNKTNKKRRKRVKIGDDEIEEIAELESTRIDEFINDVVNEYKLGNSFKKAIVENVQVENYEGYLPEDIMKEETIKKFIIKNESEIKAVRELQGTKVNEKDVVLSKNRFLLLQKNLRRIKEKERDLIEYQKKLNKTLLNRKRDKETLKTKISQKVNKLFVSFLNKQGHDGKIIFNHKAKELEINVYLNGKRGNSNNMGTFSGGERSFSTLAFVLAIGEFLETPFRAIDEFDIFMDSVNRNISMNMLIEACNNNPENQYVLITPQDLSVLKNKKDVTIHRLKKLSELGNTVVEEVEIN